MGRRIDIEANDLLEFVGKFGIVGDLERAHAMRLEPVPLPHPPHRRRTDPHCLGHRRCGPVGRLMRRGLIGQRNDTIDGLGRQRRNARGPGSVAGEPRDPLMHKTLLPAPHNGLALADSAHDGGGAVVVGGQSDDPRPPHVLLRTVAIPDDRLQASGVEREVLYRLPVIARYGRVNRQAYHVWGMDNAGILLSQRTGGGRAAALGTTRERACVPAGSDDREHARGDGA